MSDWSWVSFVAGMAAGLAVMWLAAALVMAGEERDRERRARRARRESEVRW